MARSVSRSSDVARSIRRVSRYRCGGTPKASLKDRAKWASETPLTRASRRTGHSSCEAASIRSFARSRRRNSSGSWLTRPPRSTIASIRAWTRGLWRDLQQGTWGDRELSNERPVISTDQQEARGCTGGEESHGDERSDPLISVERAIAIKTQMACITRQVHFSKLTDEVLMRMR